MSLPSLPAPKQEKEEEKLTVETLRLRADREYKAHMFEMLCYNHHGSIDEFLEQYRPSDKKDLWSQLQDFTDEYLKRNEPKDFSDVAKDYLDDHTYFEPKELAVKLQGIRDDPEKYVAFVNTGSGREFFRDIWQGGTCLSTAFEFNDLLQKS